MIRPFTLVCMLSAFGSGLYLYQSKHQAQLLDREIGRTIKQAEATRDVTTRLRADWAVLNEPDRLAELARAHTSLQTLKPTQFVGLTDLAARLPAPVAESHETLPVEAEPEEPPAAPVVQASPPVVAAPVKPRDVAVAAEPKPKPDAKPDSKPAAVAETKPAVHRVDKPVAVAAAEPAPARARPPHVQTEIALSDATAPGTVGAAVLRAMRAQTGGTFAPPVAAAPSYTPPAYAQPAYAQPAYAPPSYAPPAASVLGGRALPPPVPFAAR